MCRLSASEAEERLGEVPSRITVVARRGARWLCTATLAALLGAGLSPAAARSESQVIEISKVVAALRSAQSDDDAVAVVRGILDSLGVKVVGKGGGELGVGGGAGTAGALTLSEKGQGGSALAVKDDGSAPPTLDDVEVRAVAHAFRSGTLVGLEDLAKFWASYELTVKLPDGTRGQPNGNVIEAALRAERRGAMAWPEDPRGFAVQLVDALAHRPKYPFDLLKGGPTGADVKLPGTPGGRAGQGKPDGTADPSMAEEPLPQAAAQATQENLETGWTASGEEMNTNTAFAAAGYAGLRNAMKQGIEDAKAKGRSDLAGYAEGMLADTTAMRSTYSGMARGKPNEVLGAALDQAVKSGHLTEAKRKEIEARMSMATSAATKHRLDAAAADPRMPAEYRKMIEATQAQVEAVRKGDLKAINEASGQAARAQTDLASKQAELRRKSVNEQADRDERAAQARDDAEAIFAAGVSVIAAELDSSFAEQRERETKWSEERQRQELTLVPPDPEWEPLKSRSLQVPKSSGSTLMLDPVQVLLVNFDLIGLTKHVGSLGAAR